MVTGVKAELSLEHSSICQNPASRRAVDTSVIQKSNAREDFDTVIDEVRSAVKADATAALRDPVINSWLGRRIRNIIIDEPSVDPHPLNHSRKPLPFRLMDSRSDRERVAKRMIQGITDEEIATEMPPARPGTFANTTLLLAPGLLTGLLPVLAFQSVWPQLKDRFGVQILAADAHPMRSADANVADLVAAMEHGTGVDSDEAGTLITEADDPTPPGDVLLMGYSKGMPDILSLLVARPDLVPRIRGVVGWAGATGGSYIADGIYNKIKDIPAFDVAESMAGDVGKLLLRLAPVVQLRKIDRRLDEYDIKGAIESLTTTFRSRFLTENSATLEELGVPMFYFSGSTNVFEVPYFQVSGTAQLDEHDPNNDMQLTQDQARVPADSAPHLAMFHANHWDLSYDAFPWYTTLGSRKLGNPFARKPAMAAMLLMMSEIGIID